MNDYARVLDPGAKAAIEERLAAFERESSTQVVVAIIPSLDGQSLEDLAARTLERWGLGQKGKNNGVLLLIAMSDHRERIEVGYGLEDRLTDALSRRILEDRLVPSFRNGDYARGVLGTCEGIIEATRGAYVAAPRRRGAPQSITALAPVACMILIVIFILVIRFRGGSGMTGGGSRRYYGGGPFWWGGGGGFGGLGGGGGFSGGGGGGGGFGGFSGGGGMSGGGGASGSW